MWSRENMIIPKMSLNTEVEVALCLKSGTFWIQPQPGGLLVWQLFDDPVSIRNSNIKHPQNIT